VIIGAGPAGLAAAHELVQHGVRPIVLEKGDKVGGIARTEVHNGYRFDIGGHRFFTKVPQVQQLWEDLLGADFVLVRRLSRIYYRRRFFKYPLQLFDALSNMGPWESVLILLSFIRWQLLPLKREDSFEQWVTNRFGRRLYRTFFKGYTEKVWGIPCSQIRADWAAQRIHGLSLTSAVLNAILGTSSAKSLIDEFRYPLLGPGMMWQRMAEAVERGGGTVQLGSEVVHLERDGPRVVSITIRQNGQTQMITADHVLSSLPLPDLIEQLAPSPPREVLQAARALRHRAFILVGLIVNRPDLFPDNWIYLQSPEVSAGRVQNFKNWSSAMVPDASKTSLGVEYFCNAGDALWHTSDAELVQLAARELVQIGLVRESDEVEPGPVFRQSHAYPVYDQDYRANVNIVRGFLAGLGNLQTIGRSGMHRYNNMDHSMLTGMLAARNILGESHDLWSVNTEDSYHEQIPGNR
jgi:protoporphyrinogen oxidase